MVLLIPFLYWIQILLAPSPLHRFELRGRAQGTTWQVVYYAADSIVRKGQCDSVLASLDSSLSMYKSYSSINALNRASAHYVADAHLAAVLRKGQAIARNTGGAFDLTILPLVTAWGFGAQQHTSPPDTATVEALRNCTGYGLLRVRNNKVFKKKPCVQVDVNGIAQGYSVDVLCKYLEKRGLRNYLVEIGGELRVKGRKQPSAAPFTVGIESPEAAASYGAPLQRSLQLPEGALTASGNYRRFYLSGDKAIPHLLNPRTGFPLQNELVSVSVWAPDAITADAWDNALMVMGLDHAFRVLAKEQQLAAYFIYKKKDGTIADTATPRFAQLLAGALPQ